MINPLLMSFLDMKNVFKKATKQLFGVASVLALIHAVSAQPTVQWQKSIGGAYYEGAQSIQQTSDGGFIVVGNTITGSDYDYWIVRLNQSGILQWQRTLGGTSDDVANFIQQTSDGGYIVTGYSESNDGDVTGNHGGADYWIVKLNSIGSLQWQKSLGGSNLDEAKCIKQTSDGGYIVAGYTYSNDGDVTGNHGSFDCWIVKLTTNGNVQWQSALGGTDIDEAYSIQQTSDGGYIVAGNSQSDDGDVMAIHGLYDCWVVKLDNSGNIQWQKALGGTGDDRASSIQQTADGGYVVAGVSFSNDGDVTENHGDGDYWIVKLEGTGNLQWQQSLGGSDFEIATSIQQTADDGYIIAGYSESNNNDVTNNHGGVDFWIVKLNSTGALQWQKTLGGTGHDFAFSVQQTSDAGYITAGHSNSNDGDVTGNHGGNDFWIVKLSDMDTGAENMEFLQNISIYPNPIAQQLTIDLGDLELSNEGIVVTLMDIKGIHLLEKTTKNHVCTLDLSGLTKGLYLLKMEEKGFQVVRNLVIR
ncbi:MAG: T9SS type A sorting domain-containing protein [Saprospiraceae bacterium]|nr:T9SS type A sorting domain-containing protein [Saprospiraceae bacterium]